MLYPLFGAPYANSADVPVWKRNRHIDRWLAEGQAQAEEQEYQREQAEKEREKYEK